MAKTASKEKGKKKIETLTHEKASRLNIPTAEYQSVMRTEELSPIRVAYERRNRDLDPQLVWRGKDEQDWSDLVVPAPPLYIQEKIHPKVLIDDLERSSEANGKSKEAQIDLFANFNGLPSEAAKTEFYQHDAHWANRMILGDSLQVMASLAEREGLRGKVQCIYFDPPYGIKFNSNFQWSTTSRDVKDGKIDHITREPEQVKAFRDTWRDGIHSYLTYLRDRLTVARDLLAESGSIFVQIGDENVHRVRAVMDEVFGTENFVSQIAFTTTSGAGSFAGSTNVLASIASHLVWFARNKERVKYRELLISKSFEGVVPSAYNKIELPDGRRRGAKDSEREGELPSGAKLFALDNLVSQTTRVGQTTVFPVDFNGRQFMPKNGGWKTNAKGMKILLRAARLDATEERLGYVRYLDDFAGIRLGNVWTDAVSSFMSDKLYVVQTNPRVIQRCIMMTTDPGDLVLDPTCGSGTTAYVAEQWGRRWITTDTSRVALALARTRIMGARYPYYLLADSREGQLKEGEVTGKPPSEMPTHLDVRQGFVYERVPHITLKSIANNAEIDVIWDEYESKLELLRQRLNQALKTKWEEWEIPREPDEKWPKQATDLHAESWKERIARQKAMDASIAAKAEFEYLYDKPYDDNKRVRVAGPFTVESLSPHRVLPVGDDDELVQKSSTRSGDKDNEADFVEMILENLRTSGVQQAHKEDKIAFSSITPWPGYFVCAEGKYTKGNGKAGAEKRAGIFIGPEFGTVSRPDLVAAAREAGDAGFDVLVTCAFNYDAHSSEFNKLGKIPVLKARMNADLHMSEELKNTGKGNLFVIFGEPDIEILKAKDGQIQVKIIGVDVFHPTTGEVRSDGAEGIACWFVDTDYNEESFFVRQAYFLGANDPYKALKTTLKAEINEEAWATLHSDTSRPFDKPKSGRIAVKVINHLGDEVMKVFKV
jgi:adenine-specific DNA-methyltransferase